VLRLALVVAAAVTGLVAVVAFARSLAGGAVPAPLHIAAVGGAITVGGLAASSEDRLPRLRRIEVALFGGLALYIALAHLSVMRAGSPATAASAWATVVLHFTVLTAAYGVLIPNGRIRAAVGVLALAAAPLALLLVVALTAPAALAPVRGAGVGLPLAVLGLAAALSWTASAVIGLFRDLAIRARTQDMYELKHKIGQGGIGEVWLAEHRRLSRLAALKLIRPAALGDPATATSVACRFEVEARATARLRSPNTVEVYDYGTTRNGTFYYAMEYLEGMDLETLVGTHGPLPASRAIHLVRQACESLAEAHEAGLVHRDVKPANIFVGRLGLRHDWVKVLDFGLVTPVHADLKQEGELTGTPAYLSPETINRDRGIDPRADIYGLGLVAYFLLTGKLVFEVDDALRMAVAHALDEPMAPSTRTDNPIPPELDAIIMRCLEKDPDDRFPSAVALADALTEVAVSPWTDVDAASWWQRVTAAPPAAAADGAVSALRGSAHPRAAAGQR
jgi:hypothetical protein